MAPEQDNQDVLMQMLLRELSDLKQGISLVHQAIERLSSLEESRNRIQEDVRRLFDLYTETQRISRKQIEDLRGYCDQRFERQAIDISNIKTGVAALGGNVTNYSKVSTWVLNNGAALIIALASSAFAAWLAVHLS